MWVKSRRRLQRMSGFSSTGQGTSVWRRARWRTCSSSTPACRSTSTGAAGSPAWARTAWGQRSPNRRQKPTGSSSAWPAGRPFTVHGSRRGQLACWLPPRPSSLCNALNKGSTSNPCPAVSWLAATAFASSSRPRGTRAVSTSCSAPAAPTTTGSSIKDGRWRFMVSNYSASDLRRWMTR